MSYQCSVCSKKIEGDLLIYVDHTEKHIAEKIKADHPEWKETDGICQPCLEYYHKELKGDHSQDAFWSQTQCAARRKAISNFFAGIVNKFKTK